MKSKMKSSFTLIELLVVIAIIAILAGMLLPALNTAREKGRIASCTNNLKQFGLSSKMYENDFDGYWPVSANRGYSAIRLLVEKNYTDVKILDCPSDQTRTPQTQGAYYDYAWTKKVNRSYAVLRVLGEFKNNNPEFYRPYRPSSTKIVDGRSKVPVCYDTEGAVGGNVYYYGYGDMDMSTKHHDGRTNMLIHDGHVELSRRFDKATVGGIRDLGDDFGFPIYHDKTVTYQ